MTTTQKRLASVIVAAGAVGVGYFGFTHSDHFLNAQFAYAEEQRADLRQGLSTLKDLSDVYKTVSKVVEPSVVNIEVHKRVATSGMRMRLPQGLNIPDFPEDMLPGPAGEAVGTGSGVIMEVDGHKGYILTNNHVVGGASDMTITLSDGREIRNPKVVAADARTDLAVVSIEADRLSPSKWGNSDEMQKGDWVLAFGSPFGYVGSMTHGIISGMNRRGTSGDRDGLENFLQVDAPINPGNSGGPLVNLHGEVIGINTAIATASGGFQGVGFAIPSNQAKYVFSALKDHGSVARGWIGVSIADVSQDLKLAQSFGYTGTHGVLIQDVLPGAPATGNLKHGDVVVSFNGRHIATMSQFRAAVASTSPNTEIKLGVYRDGKEQEVAFKLGEPPNDQVAMAASGRPTPAAEAAQSTSAKDFGLSVQSLTPALTRANGAVRNAPTAGVLVSDVQPNSPAERSGIRKGEIITEVGTTAIRSTDDFDAALKKADLKSGVRVYAYAYDTPRSTWQGHYVMLSEQK